MFVRKENSLSLLLFQNYRIWSFPHFKASGDQIFKLYQKFYSKEISKITFSFELIPTSFFIKKLFYWRRRKKRNSHFLSSSHPIFLILNWHLL